MAKVVREALLNHLRRYKEIYAKVREILEMSDAETIYERWKWIKILVSTDLECFIELIKETRNLYNRRCVLLEEVKSLEKTKNTYYNKIIRRQEYLGKFSKDLLLTDNDFKKAEREILNKKADIDKRNERLDKVEQEIIIRQEDLEVRMQEVNLAKTSYYHLSEKEIEMFEIERPKILAGVEKYGSIKAACKHDPSITMRPSSVYHYAAKHKQFGEDIELAKQMFKEALDAEILERALNGTVNPVFQRGEYIGDYAVKDNKLLVEVAKAKLPEQYNPRAYAQAHPATNQGTTINIISFDGVDESKRGYVKNVGVVQSVDETGKVERITQAKRVLDYYKNQPGVEIIDVEPEAPQSDEKAG